METAANTLTLWLILGIITNVCLVMAETHLLKERGEDFTKQMVKEHRDPKNQDLLTFVSRIFVNVMAWPLIMLGWFLAAQRGMTFLEFISETRKKTITKTRVEWVSPSGNIMSRRQWYSNGRGVVTHCHVQLQGHFIGFRLAPKGTAMLPIIVGSTPEIAQDFCDKDFAWNEICHPDRIKERTEVFDLLKQRERMNLHQMGLDEWADKLMGKENRDEK